MKQRLTTYILWALVLLPAIIFTYLHFSTSFWAYDTTKHEGMTSGGFAIFCVLALLPMFLIGLVLLLFSWSHRGKLHNGVLIVLAIFNIGFAWQTMPALFDFDSRIVVEIDNQSDQKAEVIIQFVERIISSREIAPNSLITIEEEILASGVESKLSRVVLVVNHETTGRHEFTKSWLPDFAGPMFKRITINEDGSVEFEDVKKITPPQSQSTSP